MQQHEPTAMGSEHLKPSIDIEQIEPTDDLFMVRTANHWMEQASTRPVPRMLFGKFWYEGELCILFADSNLGKSILAVQIGNIINTGMAMHPFIVESLPQPIL